MTDNLDDDDSSVKKITKGLNFIHSAEIGILKEHILILLVSEALDSYFWCLGRQ